MRPPSTQTVYELFNNSIQFLVPTYQRAYVWNEERNWAVLWEDIVETAQRYLDEPESQDHSGHFLGPVVLEQQPSMPGAVDPRLVIDGQQRLTTFQLILSAAAAAARDHGCFELADEIAALTVNRGHRAEGDLRFKVWPSRRDRAAFVEVMQAGAPPSAKTGLPGAWTFFRKQMDPWLTADGAATAAEVKQRVAALQTCIQHLISVVSINLDQTDNAQVIFETLNARGTGLGALDLVKNATFLQAEREGADVEALYDRHWEPTFEAPGDDYWLEEVSQGREKRPRSDWFLMHWLAMELGGVVRSAALFDTFRKRVLHAEKPPPVDDLVPRLCADARLMRSFDDLERGTPEQLFFSRMEALETSTMLPVALLLFRSREVTAERRRRALAAIESWLVRRAVLRYTGKNYNRSLTALLKDIKENLADADVAVVNELASSQAETALWPSDDAVLARLEMGEVYGYIGLSRLRMLLEACELDVRDGRTESKLVAPGLTIEHALPQAWEEYWPTPDGMDLEAFRKKRNDHVHRLGNLTLITQPLNSTLSNAPWTATATCPNSKRDELRKRSVMLINQQLCEYDEWNEERIDERSAELARHILRTWPGPHSTIWTPPCV